MLNRTLRTIVMLSIVGFISAAAQAQQMWVYFGTHTAGAGKGFSLARFDTRTGALNNPKYLLDASAPAFFVIHPDGKHLYTCNSNSPGGISAYEIDPRTGSLTLLNKKTASGGDPSFVSLDKTGRFVLDANYQGGNLEIYAIQPDGSLGERTAFDQHTGSGVNPTRQAHAYAHSIITDPTNRFVLCADLGVDKVYVYRFDEKTGAIQANDPPFASIKPGSGARHVRFHPNGKTVYLISEIASTITAMNWDSDKGMLSEFQTVSTLPTDFKGISTCAEMEVRPDGKFLYATNRGDDSIAAFAIDPQDGKLTFVQRIASGGKTPRNFAFDPSANWIICTNHGSNNAVVFRVDSTTGKLTQHGEPVEVPYPFCERFLAIPADAATTMPGQP